MKHRLKKIMSIVLAASCIFIFTACTSSKKDGTISKEMSSKMISTAEKTLMEYKSLTDQQISEYEKSKDEFKNLAATTWKDNRGELGSYQTSENGEITQITDGYSVTIDTKFSKREATWEFVFDEEGKLTSMAVSPEYSLGEKMAQAGGNTVMGVGVVFFILIFLSFLISLFRFIPIIQEKMNKKEPKEEAKEEKILEASVVEEIDQTELIAVITAAIAAAEVVRTDDFVVRSIKKINHTKW